MPTNWYRNAEHRQMCRSFNESNFRQHTLPGKSKMVKRTKAEYQADLASMMETFFAASFAAEENPDMDWESPEKEFPGDEDIDVDAATAEEIFFYSGFGKHGRSSCIIRRWLTWPLWTDPQV